MLSKHYRLEIENNSGVSVTVEIDRQGFKFDSTGTLVFEAAATNIATGLAVSTGATGATGWVDNGTLLHIGADFEITVVAGGSPNGAVNVRLQRSVDAGASAIDAKSGEFIAGFNVTAAATYRKTVRVD